MSETLEQAFSALRREYLAEAPGRLAELRKDIAAYRAGEPDATSSLRTRFHRLAGSGGSYGFPIISDISRETEHWLKDVNASAPSAENITRLEEAVQRLSGAFNQAATEVGLPAEPVRAVEFGWRSLVIGPVGKLRDQIEYSLETSGFLVRVDTGSGEPKQLPVSERPDLLVIIADSQATDAYAIASAWSSAGAVRPRAIVLVDPGENADQIRAIASGIDVVFPAQRLLQELPKYAKTLARIGTPPSRVLLVEEDSQQANNIVALLEQANVRVTQCRDGVSAREMLARETPDLLLMDMRLPGDLNGLALARLVRQDARFGLIPIVFLTAQDTVADQIEALRAGADHFLNEPVDQVLLTQLVINRAERGRRIREMVHRDGLTGLLNHATLMAELEHSVEYARRHDESFAFIMVDVDHFKRVNDRYGHLVGDQVLLHVAKIFQSTARASDLIGRYGGEEFALILRRTDQPGAAVLADKLRKALAERPAVVGPDESIPVRVCMGVACYPADGTTAATLATQADEALYRAKAGGRDRVEYAEQNRGRE
jgi:diguanylate cyclase (GGDEF)-like protein